MRMRWSTDWLTHDLMGIKILNPIAEVLHTDEQIVPIFPSRADLEAFPTAENATWPKGDALAITLGRTSRFDGIYGLWAWNEDSSAVAGVNVVLPAAFTTVPTPNGRWLRIFCECGALR